MRSNRYTLTFMAILTVVLGFLLSYSATSLKSRQQRNIEIDMKKNILRSVHIPENHATVLTPGEIETLFQDMIKTIHVDENGNEISSGGKTVYVKIVEGKPQGYSIPISGKGLWSTIYGYMAIEPDGQTVKGVTFYKHGETPGLGGEVEKDWFTYNFVGKRIISETGELVGVQVNKGNVAPDDSEGYHKVDGISGATMTGKGVSKFILQNLKEYEMFFSKIRQQS